LNPHHSLSLNGKQEHGHFPFVLNGRCHIFQGQNDMSMRMSKL